MKKYLTLSIIFLTFSAFSLFASSYKPFELRCENLSNPLGIDNIHPHFSWKNTMNYVKAQTAYEIQVGTDSSRLAGGIADLWKSGKVSSDESVMVSYKGKSLSSRELCYWRVRVWNESDRMSEWSDIGRFSVGILDGTMQGDFISMSGDSVSAPILRKSFECAKHGPVFLYVNSLGYHEVYINGHKISDAVLTPAVSQLDKRSLVMTYDVSRFIHEGQNEIAIWLGKGWYKKTTFNSEHNGPVVRAEMSALDDGKWKPILVTDKTWSGRESGYFDTGTWKALQFGGERIDASMLPASLSREDLDKLEWGRVSIIKMRDRIATPQMCEPNIIHSEFSPISIARTKDDEWIVDMGKTLTGWFELSVSGLNKGHEITVSYSDYRKPDGQLEEQGEKDSYICSGNECDIFRNKFSHHAFRYARISNLPYRPDPDDIKAYSIYGDYSPAHTFVCSDNDLNSIYDMISWTLRCLTFSGYMVDCPHLERMGYGGDGNSSTNILQTLFNVDPVFVNWLQAWTDVQKEDGGLPHVAPAGGGGGGPYWCGFIVLAPWRTYVNYNDTRLMIRCYEAMKRWLGYVDIYVKDGLLRRWPDTSYREWYLGDWLAPAGVDSGNQNSIDLVNNCLLSECLGVMSRIASFMGEASHAKEYASRKAELNKRIHSEFFDEKTCTYATGSQIDMAYPLITGVVPVNLRGKVAQVLKNRTETMYNDHLGVGLVGIPVLTQWAIDSKEADFFYRMLKQQDYPGYLFMIRNGATTTWESWDASRSHVHNCYNGVGNWFTQAVGGIRPDTEAPGYKNFYVDPQIPEGVTWAKSTKETPYGTILFDWKMSADSLEEHLTVPSGSTATIIVPTRFAKVMINGRNGKASDSKIVLPAGTYDIHFTK